MKRIITACPNGIASSQSLAYKINEMLEERGFSERVEVVDGKSIRQWVKNADIYIQIIPDKEPFDIPVIQGLPFITGIGKEKAMEELIECIKK